MSLLHHRSRMYTGPRMFVVWSVKTWAWFPPGDEDAALESEDELRLRLLALSGADTLVEVGLVTDIDSTFS